LAELVGFDDFVHRHIGPSPHEQAHMLATIGAASMDELIGDVVPAGIRFEGRAPSTTCWASCVRWRCRTSRGPA
jgi:glycine cleavage system pyridoxal-binding protein P